MPVSVSCSAHSQSWIGMQCLWPRSLDVQHQCAACLQHAATALLRQMLSVLDLAADTGTPSDKRAADRLQRRCTGCVLMLPSRRP